MLQVPLTGSRVHPHNESSGSPETELVQRIESAESCMSRMASHVTNSWLMPQYLSLGAPEALTAVMVITEVLPNGLAQPLDSASRQ